MSFIWIHHFPLFTSPISVVEIVENNIITATSRNARHSIIKPIIIPHRVLKTYILCIKIFFFLSMTELCHRIACEVYVELTLKSWDIKFSRKILCIN